MGYTSKYKQAEIETILDAKNNTGAGVDATLDGLFIDALQTKVVELSESAEITPDEGYLGLKKVNVSVKGGGSGGGESADLYVKREDIPESVLSLTLGVSHTVKVDVGGNIVISPTALEVLEGGSFAKLKERFSAIAINPNGIYGANPEGNVVTATISEFLTMSGVDIASIAKMTKEKFYAL